MRVLFLGGNGNISWWCVQKALEQGYDVYELNRGITRATRREVQTGVHQIIADIRDEEAVSRALNGLHFDVVCDFICFNREQAEKAVRLFSRVTEQYIVISSEAVYQRKSAYLPFKENTPKYSKNVDDKYIAGKLEVESVFVEAFEKSNFPVTIVRPGFTYDTILQVPIGQNCFTAPKWYLKGYPFLVPGDGENLWAPLHSKDFANAFISLIGEKNAIGEEYHIAGEMLITLNEMAKYILSALSLNEHNTIHIPRDEAIKITEFYGEIITKQHMWHYIYDLKKIKSIALDWSQVIDFKRGIKMTVDWLNEKEERKRVNARFNETLNYLYNKYS